LAAVNEGNVRLAGELADGVCVHPFNTPRYLRESILPWLEDSAEEHGRGLDDVVVSASPLVVTGSTESETESNREMARMRVAFYGSTPAYKPVMQAHGWESLGRELHRLSREGRWGDMMSLVDDDVLSEFVVEAPVEDVAGAVLDEYGDVADRVVFDVETGFRGQDWWQRVVDDWKA
ncbi:MAG: LLM class flavin-dependent oxidoreductase, partial [Halobacteriota archaeon]